MTILVLTLAAVPIAIVTALALWIAATRRPRTLVDPPRDVFITAAHPDDCVILAGAYALRALAEGCQVQVCYFTCGAAPGDDERAARRTEEARTAWRSAGLEPDALEFLGLPEQAPGEPEARPTAELDRLRARLEARLGALAAGTAVFVPAAGEAHVDHRVLRRLVLEAWRNTGRRDLVVYEGAEYNDYHSLVQAPTKVVRAVLEALPLVGHRLRELGPAAWTGFVAGGPPWQLARDPVRMAKRAELLRAFGSEDGALLVKLFGTHERYRPIDDPAAALASESPGGYLRIGGRLWSASALLVLVVLLDVLAIAAAGLVNGIVAVTGAATTAVLLALAAALVVAGLGLRRGLARETRLAHAAIAIGLAIGAALAV